jgi:hypothetical protein
MNVGRALKAALGLLSCKIPHVKLTLNLLIKPSLQNLKTLSTMEVPIIETKTQEPTSEPISEPTSSVYTRRYFTFMRKDMVRPITATMLPAKYTMFFWKTEQGTIYNDVDVLKLKDSGVFIPTSFPKRIRVHGDFGHLAQSVQAHIDAKYPLQSFEFVYYGKPVHRKVGNWVFVFDTTEEKEMKEIVTPFPITKKVNIALSPPADTPFDIYQGIVFTTTKMSQLRMVALSSIIRQYKWVPTPCPSFISICRTSTPIVYELHKYMVNGVKVFTSEHDLHGVHLGFTKWLFICPRERISAPVNVPLVSAPVESISMVVEPVVEAPVTTLIVDTPANTAIVEAPVTTPIVDTLANMEAPKESTSSMPINPLGLDVVPRDFTLPEFKEDGSNYAYFITHRKKLVGMKPAAKNYYHMESIPCPLTLNVAFTDVFRQFQTLIMQYGVKVYKCTLKYHTNSTTFDRFMFVTKAGDMPKAGRPVRTRVQITKDVKVAPVKPKKKRKQREESETEPAMILQMMKSQQDLMNMLAKRMRLQ